MYVAVFDEARDNTAVDEVIPADEVGTAVGVDLVNRGLGKDV